MRVFQKKQMMKKYKSLLFLSIVISSTVAGQTPYDPEQQLFRYGARASSFAGAYVSEIYDLGSMYWNPASLSHLHRRTIFFNYQQEWAGKMKSELFAFPLPSGFVMSTAGGINAAQLTIPDQSHRQHLGLIYGFDFVAAFRLAPTFSIGARNSVYSYNMNTHSTWASSLSIGLLYAPSPDISYGMVLSDIGKTISFMSGVDSIALLRTSLPKRLSVGLTMRFPSSRSERIVSIILANDKTFGQRGLRYNGAIEWTINSILDLRTGYVVSPTYAGAKYGIGIHAGRVQFDYAISPSTLTNRFHEFTCALIL